MRTKEPAAGRFDMGPAWGRIRKVIAMLLALYRFILSWKRYNASLRELSRLGDRELADIGISRSDIPRVAWDNASN
jgi:uncharacterized protein YjiS (DUF1127 family)